MGAVLQALVLPVAALQTNISLVGVLELPLLLVLAALSTPMGQGEQVLLSQLVLAQLGSMGLGVLHNARRAFIVLVVPIDKLALRIQTVQYNLLRSHNVLQTQDFMVPGLQHSVSLDSIVLEATTNNPVPQTR